MIYIVTIIGIALGIYTIIGSIKGLNVIEDLESKYRNKTKRSDINEL